MKIAECFELCILVCILSSQRWVHAVLFLALISAVQQVWCRMVKGKVLVAHSCLTLCDPVDYSPPGSSVHGIF